MDNVEEEAVLDQIFKEDDSMSNELEIHVATKPEVEAIDVPVKSVPVKSAPARPAQNRKPASVSEHKKGLAKPENRQSVPVGGQSSTVISEDSVMIGNITTASTVSIFGKMKGNIKSSEKVSIYGKLIGNIDAQEVYLDGEAVMGDVQSSGDVETMQGSVLVGDVNCENITISGALKGNIEAQNTVVLKPQAVVEGDISAERIEMSGGAVLNGRTNIRGAVNTAGLFDIEEGVEPTFE